jgi:hypothetical protein
MSKKGQQVGDFSLKFTSFTIAPGPVGPPTIHGNVEGTGAAPKQGTVIGTATFVGSDKGGVYNLVGINYQDDGEVTALLRTGTYESSGKHRWRTESSDLQMIGEGELDLASRSWKGKIYKIAE